MTNILLSGANGKMGQAVVRTVEGLETAKIVAGFDINTEVKNDFPVYNDLSKVIEKVDVLIDFSHPSMLEDLLEFSISNLVPAVICTTGLTADKLAKIDEASKKVPIFFSANMSLGVNLLIDLVCRASKILEDNFDIEIIEKHHNLKIYA
ncbi:MAG: 4-hydroxy-tetrahydrodipicolinate reductase, partial [Oscillospiraceae bacterium]